MITAVALAALLLFTAPASPASASSSAIEGGCATVPAFQLLDIDAAGALFIPTQAKELLHGGCLSSSDFYLVGVSGPYHSGKSFMLNALVNRTRSSPVPSPFEVGKTTESQTRGMWLHGGPLDRRGLDHGVVFLDCEGLAATENTEQHDAKLFAISTLLTAHHLFNTIRNIDTHSLDALEILARRARLFQLKSGLKGAEAGIGAGAGDFMLSPEGALLAFPTLTWVVQNFYQAQIGGETPTEWLHRLLRAVVETRQVASSSLSDEASSSGGPLFLAAPPSVDDEGDGAPSASLSESRAKSTLMDIFPGMTATTMGLPSVKRAELGDLGTADLSKLEAEYVEDAATLWGHIDTALGENPSARVLSGPTLHAFLSVLVSAANEGNMDSVPSMWRLYVQSQVREASDAATALFSRRALALDLRVPTPMAAYTKSVGLAAKAANGNIRELLFGLSIPTTEAATKGIFAKIQSLERRKLQGNRQAIKDHVQRAADGLKTKGKANIAAITVPAPSKNVREQVRAFVKETMDLYLPATEAYDAKVTQSVTDALSEALKAAETSVLDKNRRLLEAIVAKGRKASTKAYDGHFTAAAFPGEACASEKEVVALATEATEAGMRAFKAETELAAGEKAFAQQNKDARNTLTLQRRSWDAKNEKCIHTFCTREYETQLAYVEGEARAVSATFPEYENRIVHRRWDGVGKSSDNQYAVSSAKQFAKSAPFKKLRATLAKQVVSRRGELIKQNERVIKRQVQPALDEVKEDFLDDVCPCSITQPACSCRGWFLQKINKKTTRALKRKMTNDKMKQHIPKIIEQFVETDLKRKMQEMAELDWAHNKAAAVAVAVAAVVVGVLAKKVLF